MNATLRGIVIQKMDMRTGQKSDGTTWSMQDILVETVDQQYANKVLLKFINKPTDGIVPGQIYQFDFSVEAREYNGRWYNDVKCWRYSVPGVQQQAPVQQQAQPQPRPYPQQQEGVYYQNPQQPQPMQPQGGNDDLPF